MQDVLFCTLSYGKVKYSRESEGGNLMEYTGTERRVKERRTYQRRNEKTRIDTSSNVDRRKGKRR